MTSKKQTQVSVTDQAAFDTMRVMVLNLGGNVGKTASCVHLLAPRLGNVQIKAVETINSTAAASGLSVEQFKGNQFRQIFKQLLVEDVALIDVGASNIEALLANMEQFKDSHEEIDYFVVPVTPGQKEQRESLATITALHRSGVSKKKIRVLFNRVEDSLDVFNTFIEKVQDIATTNQHAVIEENDMFELLARHEMSLDKILNDDTDYRKQLRETEKSDVQAVNALTEMMTLRSGAKALAPRLDRVFTALFTG